VKRESRRINLIAGFPCPSCSPFSVFHTDRWLLYRACHEVRSPVLSCWSKSLAVYTAEWVVQAFDRAVAFMFSGKPICPRDSTGFGGDKSNNDIQPLDLWNQSWIEVRSEPAPAGRSLRMFSLPKNSRRLVELEEPGAWTPLDRPIESCQMPVRGWSWYRCSNRREARRSPVPQPGMR
jgi:hypothetical protein